MFSITTEMLKKLKCAQCDCFLSYKPIMLRKDGKSVCGRCKKEDEDMIINEAYENLAKFVSFPCRYHSNGCSLKLNLDEVIQHETHCTYGLHMCPSFMNNNYCNWIGNLKDIENHYKIEHSDFVIKHPYFDKIDLKEDYQKFFIFKTLGFLFILEVECNTSQGVIMHNVLILEDLTISSLFKYFIKFCDQNNCISKSNNIYPYGRIGISKKYKLITKISNLLDEFKNHNINFEMRVTMDNVKCNSCKKCIISAPIKYLEEYFYCNDCTGNNRCKNSVRGCNFIDSDEFVMKKHEYWLCKYNDVRCYKCGLRLFHKSRLIHYDNIHDIHKTATGSGNTVNITFKGPFKKNLSYIINAHNNKFRLSFFFVENVFSIVLTEFESRKSSQYFTCSYSICYNKKSLLGHLEAITKNNFGTYWLVTDWHATVFKPHSHLKEKKMDCNDITFKLTITKK